ncbi:MAG: D-glycero-beta-D-manno-heptose-7-phosphate kinase [Candidatus Wallbacteria bacterium]|nr:D-glycero-beta-D-manno-heptose-7-phosphate kinase [Candidatus Wallbacteria bacterium]
MIYDSQATKRLLKILTAVRSRRILVIGDLILDEYIWGDATRISPEAPVPVIKVSSRTYSPGGAANVANNLHALGVKVSICGVLGDDGYGRLFRQLLIDLGINTEGLEIDKLRPTTVKTRIMAHSYQIARADSESTDPIGSGINRPLLSKIRDKASGSDLVIVSDYAKGVITESLSRPLLTFLRKMKIPVTVDPKVINFRLFKGANTITPNKKEAEEASGIAIRDKKSLIKAGRKLIRDMNSDYLLITRGEEGMSLFSQKNVFHIPTVARAVYDVTGAGDTVIAHYSACLAAGAEPVDAAILANIAAGIKVTKLGSAAVTAEEVAEHIRNGHECGEYYAEELK